MSNSETIYATRDAYPQQITRERAQTVTFPLYRNGALVAPTAEGSSYDLFYEDNTDTPKIADNAVTVSGSIAQSSLTALNLPSTLDFGDGYWEIWTLVLPDGTTREFRRPARVVKRAIYPVISDIDLIACYSDLADLRPNSLASYQTYIDEAWKRILGRLEAQGRPAYLVMSPYSFREVHLELTLCLIFADFRTGHADGRWGQLTTDHRDAFRRAWLDLRFEYDYDGDGVEDGTGHVSATYGAVFTNRPPATRWGMW